MIVLNDNRDPVRSKNKEYYSCNFLYYDEQGKKHRTPTKKFYVKTIGEARRAKEEYRIEMERKLNQVTLHPDMTVSEYCDNWQKRRTTGELQVKGKRVKKSTLDRDAKIELPKIKRLLGDLLICEITKKEVQSAKSQLIEQGASQSVMHHFEQKLKQMLKQAVRDEILDRNPFDFLDVTVQPKAPERKPLNERQFNLLRDTLLDNLDGKKVAIYLCLATGMRRGEALGLQWKHIDLEYKVVSIEQQLNDASEIDPVLKTDDSDGIVTLPSKAVKYLERWREIQSKHFTVTPDTFVCSNLKGDHLSVRSFQNFRRALFVELKLEDFTLHDLRHTQATILFLDDTDIKTVQKRLRHRTHHMTLGIYTHTTTQAEREAADKIDKRL